MAVDSKDFIYNTFMETYQSVCIYNTNNGDLEFIRHDDPNVNRNEVIDGRKYIKAFIDSGRIVQADIEKFDKLLNLEQLKNTCINKENGSLFTYRVIDELKVRWVRTYISIPDNYSDDNPQILLYRRDMLDYEADIQDVAQITDDNMKKILRVDWKNRLVRPIKIIKEEANLRERYWQDVGTNKLQILEEEFVHPEDLKIFREETNLEQLTECFAEGNSEKSIWYRRKKGMIYHWVKLNIYKASEYTVDNPIVLYCIEDVDKEIMAFWAQNGRANLSGKYARSLENDSEYYKNVLSTMSYFLQRYIDFYSVDLETDTYIQYKIGRNILSGEYSYMGKYSDVAAKFINSRKGKEVARVHANYDTTEKIKEMLYDKLSAEYTYYNADGKLLRTIWTKIESKNGIPTKAVCRTLLADEVEKLFVKTFGNFEIFDNKGDVVKFKRGKAKQVVAYLIDKHGYAVSTKEIVMDVLEKDADDKNAIKYVSTLIKSAQADLEALGYSNIILKEWNSVRINVPMIDCDYYHLLDGDTSYLNLYHNEYMKQYSWAEDTNAEILNSSL